MDEYLDIGRLLRPKGLAGHVWVQVFSDDPLRLIELEDFFVQRQGRRERLSLAEGEFLSGKLLFRFEGVESREAAEALHGLALQIHRRDLPPLEEKEFFLADLPGLEVRLEDDRLVGRVADVLDMPASPVLVIRAGQHEALVPAIGEFMPALDVEAGRITIRPLEGMLPEGMLEAAAAESAGEPEAEA